MLLSLVLEPFSLEFSPFFLFSPTSPLPLAIHALVAFLTSCQKPCVLWQNSIRQVRERDKSTCLTSYNHHVRLHFVLSVASPAFFFRFYLFLIFSFDNLVFLLVRDLIFCDPVKSPLLRKFSSELYTENLINQLTPTNFDSNIFAVTPCPQIMLHISVDPLVLHACNQKLTETDTYSYVLANFYYTYVYIYLGDKTLCKTLFRLLRKKKKKKSFSFQLTLNEFFFCMHKNIRNLLFFRDKNEDLLFWIININFWEKNLYLWNFFSLFLLLWISRTYYLD